MAWLPKKTKKDSKVFLVKHVVDSADIKISQVGPFHDKEEALSTCIHFLKKGTCSWLVGCNG